MNKNAICMTVYKNRYTHMLQLIKDIKGFDIFIVAQRNDPNLNEYYEYDAEVLVPDVKSIFDKREYIRNEMIDRGYEGFFMIDDDIKAFVKITEETKRTTSDTYRPTPTNIQEVLDKMLAASTNLNCDFVGIALWQYLGFSRPNKINVNKSLNCGQFVYFRTAALKELDLHYDTSGLINEDLDMVIRLLQHGKNCCTVMDYTYIQGNHRYSKKHVSETTLYENGIKQIERMNMRNVVKHHSSMKIRPDGILTNVIRFNKYYNTFELPKVDEKILEFCKDEDLEGLREYLKNIKDSKKN